MGKPQKGSPAAQKPAQDQDNWVLVRDKELMALAKRATAFVMEKRLSDDYQKFVRENVEELKAIRNAVSNLEPFKYRGLRSWYQAYGVDGAVQFPVGRLKDDGSREYVDCSVDLLWCLYGNYDSSFFGAWLRLLEKTGNRNNPDINRARLSNMKEVVRLASSQGPIRTASITSIDDITKPDANPFLLIRDQSIGSKQDSLHRDVQTVQRRIDWIVAKQLRRRGEQEINEAAQAEFGGEEPEAELPSPTHLLKEAEDHNNRAKIAGVAGEYEKASYHTKEARRLRKEAEELEKQIRAAEESAIIEEAHEVPLAATTASTVGPINGEISLADRGVRIREVPTETPETLTAEAETLETQMREAASGDNPDYARAQSFRDRAKAKRERAGQLRAEAERAAAKAAAEKAKLEGQTASVTPPSGEKPNTEKSEKGKRRNERRATKQTATAADESSSNEEPASPPPAPAVEGPAASSSSDTQQLLKKLAARFASGEINKQEHDEMKAALLS